MVNALLFLLLAVDVGLIFAFVVLAKRKTYSGDLLVAITEERKLLSELFQVVKEELEFGRAEIKKNLNHFSSLGAEIELEITTGKEALKKEMERVMAELSTQIQLPAKEVIKQRSYMEDLLRKIKHERNLLVNALARGEKLTDFFNKDLSYDEVIKDIQDKKYSDARDMLSKGMLADEVAKELGLSAPEIKLIASLAY